MLSWVEYGTVRSIRAYVYIQNKRLPPPPPVYLDLWIGRDTNEAVFQKVIACSDVYEDFYINGYWCIVCPNLQLPAYSNSPPPRLVHLEEFSNPPAY